MNAIVTGPDAGGLGDALRSEGVSIARVDGLAGRSELEEAGVADADLFVLTDVAQATAIPVARDVNDELRVVVYSADSLPEFARPLADLIVDPALLDPEAVAEEIVR